MKKFIELIRKHSVHTFTDFEIVSEYKETTQLFDYSKIVEGIQKNKADSKEEKAALAEAKKAAKKAEKTKDT